MICPVSKRAWDTDYRGNGATLLEKIAISAMSQPCESAYTNQISIIQSSGTGKSRTVDELAKRLFSFPFNLREQAADIEGELVQ